MAKVIYRLETFGKGKRCVALCPEFGISRSGKTPEVAREWVAEVIESYIRRCEWDGVLDGVLEDAGFEKTEDTWRLTARETSEQVVVTDPGAKRTPREDDAHTKDYSIELESGHKVKVKKLSKEDVKQKLSEFEKKYGMTSYDFAVKYNSCGFEEENPEFMDWISYYYMAGTLGLVS